ncbi:unnamed protein product [Enterobius vermicularis]|uniref:Cytochrome b561 domain-containing protein n=1 Tax=Enterobius vermicularis TaxID=51028 RepID=A0A0N4VEA2_ENTVE|nr:unnamed protein product [Enterobius vermicularis]
MLHVAFEVHSKCSEVAYIVQPGQNTTRRKTSGASLSQQPSAVPQRAYGCVLILGFNTQNLQHIVCTQSDYSLRLLYEFQIIHVLAGYVLLCSVILMFSLESKWLERDFVNNFASVKLPCVTPWVFGLIKVLRRVESIVEGAGKERN